MSMLLGQSNSSSRFDVTPQVLRPVDSVDVTGYREAMTCRRSPPT